MMTVGMVGLAAASMWRKKKKAREVEVIRSLPPRRDPVHNLRLCSGGGSNYLADLLEKERQAEIWPRAEFEGNSVRFRLPNACLEDILEDWGAEGVEFRAERVGNWLFVDAESPSLGLTFCRHRSSGRVEVKFTRRTTEWTRPDADQIARLYRQCSPFPPRNPSFYLLLTKYCGHGCRYGGIGGWPLRAFITRATGLCPRGRNRVG